MTMISLPSKTETLRAIVESPRSGCGWRDRRVRWTAKVKNETCRLPVRRCQSQSSGIDGLRVACTKGYNEEVI